MAQGRRRRGRGPIPRQEELFLLLTIETGSPVAQKQALQRLCSLLRAGFRLSSPFLVRALLTLHLHNADEKVRRWAFNTLALIGTAEDSGAMLVALDSNRNHPEIFESGLTALAAVLERDDLTRRLSKLGVELTPGVVMALAQQSREYESDLKQVTLRPELATPDEIKSAALLVGLGRAPRTLFSSRHAVPDVIGEFNTHEDSLVSQYSFWAVVENPQLGFHNLRVRSSQLGALAPNAQGWAIRVFTKDSGIARQSHDLITSFSESEHYEAREGLAIGLRGVFYDSIEVAVTDWYWDQDEVEPIKDRLLEHMAANANHCEAYQDIVLEAYRLAPVGSLRRARLDAAALGRDKLHLELRRMALAHEEPDLFAAMSGGGITVNQTINNSNIGGVSGSGTGNTGTVNQIVFTPEQIKATDLLNRLGAELRDHPDHSVRKQGEELIAQATEKPTKGALERVIGWIGLASSGAKATSGLVTSMGTLSDQLQELAPHLPHLG